MDNPDHQRAWDYLLIQSDKGIPFSVTIIEAILGMADHFPHKYARTPASNFEAHTREMLALILESINHLEVVAPTMPVSAILDDNDEDVPMSASALQLFASFEDDSDEWD